MQSGATHTLADLVDLARLQRMCDSFAAAGDIGLAVLDPGGTVLCLLYTSPSPRDS